MTSASELFYTRRSRLGRPDPDLAPDIPLYRSSNHRRHHHGHQRHDSDGCNPLRRSSHARHLIHRGRLPVRHDQSAGQFLPSNNVNTESPGSTSPAGSAVNERLPGAVLLARARLLERLRGVSLSGNRRSSRASLELRRGESIFGSELRLVDAGDWLTDSSVVQFPHPGSNSQTEELHQNRKPPSLSQEEFDSLATEVFSCTKITAEARDCSICLESFVDGDILTSLPCEHRFHSSCLDPWVRTHGSCPCCRRCIRNASENSRSSSP